VPQNPGGIFQNPYECCNFDFVALDRWSSSSVSGEVQLPQVGKSSEAPITFLGNESVMRVCFKKSFDSASMLL